MHAISCKFVSKTLQSAGGHLTILSAFHLLKTRPAFQLSGLVCNYGAYDLSLLPQARNFPKPIVLSPEMMANFMQAFLPDRSAEECRDPAISPFFQDLTGMKLPSALFTCGTEVWNIHGGDE